MLQKKIKLKLHSEIDAEIQINKKILQDFEEFKVRNNLSFCSFHLLKTQDDTITTSWSTTFKYQSKLNIQEIENEFEKFKANNSSENCQISKITCQDNTSIAEFSIYRTYLLC